MRLQLFKEFEIGQHNLDADAATVFLLAMGDKKKHAACRHVSTSTSTPHKIARKFLTHLTRHHRFADKTLEIRLQLFKEFEMGHCN